MRFIFFFIVFFVSESGFGQAFPQNSLYLTDLYNINPAYGGLERSLSVNFNYRDQWSGVTSHPKQIYLNAHMPLYLFNGGVGIELQSDVLGALRKSSFQISYNYITKSRFGLLSYGGSIGYVNTGLDGSQIITPDGIYLDGQIDHQDTRLAQQNRIGSSLSYELGVFIGNESFDLGLSVSNFLLSERKIDGLTVENQEVMQAFLRLPLYRNDFIIYPSLLVKTDFQSIQTDISCLVKNGNVFGGTSIRGYSRSSIDAIVLILGFQMNSNYTISYSYDIGLNSLRNVSEGSHEININYNLNKLIGVGLLPEIIYNPRNL